jgi:arylsulfatase A-like enzyme
MAKRASRLILLATLAATIAVGFASAERQRGAGGGERPPNVLLIVTDDQRVAGTMGTMKRTRRAFADRGTKFTRAFASTPFCCPSRASIFSGRFAHNHGIRANDGTGFDADQTWEAELDRAGYLTGLFGKYLNRVSAARAPHFDRSAAVRPGDPRDPELIAGHARAFLKAAEATDSQPWALVLATMSPHQPFNSVPADPKPLPKWRPPRSLGEGLGDKHPAVAAAAERYLRFGRDYGRGLRRGQLLELKRLDHAIGDVMKQVRKRGERRDTLAIFTSDNGFLWGQHGVYAKLWPYLESVRVPLFMAWPGRIAEGERDRRLAMNIDLAPTILDAAGIQPTYPVDGRSLLGDERRRWVFLESADDVSGRVPDWRAMVDAERQYIEWEDGFVESYDLDRDRRQMRASNAPDPQRAAMLAAAASCAGAACP